MWTKKSIIETISAILVFLFIYTALSKYIDFQTFTNALHKSPLLSNYAIAVGYLLPALELATVILIIIPKTRLLGFYSALSLLTIFTIYLIYMIKFTPKLPCTCGGVISQLSWTQHIYFNLFFICITLFGISIEKSRANIRLEISEAPNRYK